MEKYKQMELEVLEFFLKVLEELEDLQVRVEISFTQEEQVEILEVMEE